MNFLIFVWQYNLKWTKDDFTEKDSIEKYRLAVKLILSNHEQLHDEALVVSWYLQFKLLFHGRCIVIVSLIIIDSSIVYRGE